MTRLISVRTDGGSEETGLPVSEIVRLIQESDGVTVIVLKSGLHLRAEEPIGEVRAKVAEAGGLPV